MIEFAWFYILKTLIIMALLGIIAMPFWKQFKAEGNFKVTKKYPYVVAVFLVMMLVFSPIKIDQSTQSDAVLRSYDTPTATNIGEIDARVREKYQAPSNEKQIEEITSNQKED